MRKLAILLAERDETLRCRLHSLLLREGFEVSASADSTSILRALRQRQNLDLLITAASLESADDGLAVVRLARRWNSTLPVMVLASNSSEDLAIAALRVGVSDYFRVPFADDDFLASVRRCFSHLRPPESVDTAEIRSSLTRSATGSDLTPMIGESRRMQEIKAYLLKVAATDSNVLITGETGTGKELVADLIHRHSQRQQKPFVCINCAAIPDSLLESELFGYERGAFTGAHALKEGALKLADGGTVFFDEIGDMSLYAQAKILRAIESKEVRRLGGKGSIPLNIRVISATNRNLEQLMAEDKFRADLYFRVNVASIQLPPLRERKEDLSALCDYHIRAFNQRFGLEVAGFSDEAFACLARYSWPGNVRELKNLIEAAFINRPERRISLADLPDQFRRRLSEATGLPEDERDRLLHVLFATNWNKSQAAQQLHWSRMTVYRKMLKYHLVRGGKTNA